MDSPTAVSEGPAAPGSHDRFDVLRYRDGTHRAVPAGDGRPVVAAHESEAHRRRSIATATVAGLPPLGGAVAGLVSAYSPVVLGAAGLALGVVAGAVRYSRWSSEAFVPEIVASDAPPRVVREYVEGFDPEEVTSPLD